MPQPDLAYAHAIKTVRERVQSYAIQRFRAGELRDADAARFVREVVPVVLAGRRQVSALTDAYLSGQLRALGIGGRPAGVIDTDSLRGVPAAAVYERPYVSARRALSKGAALEIAVAVGATRVNDLVLTDMQLAKTHTARNTFQNAGVERYARVLGGGGNCALCTVAATNTYYVADLLPIHPGCNCGVRALPPGERVDVADLTAEQGAMQERFGASASDGRAVDYRKALLVREHGELGPVLTVRKHRFTGPAQV